MTDPAEFQEFCHAVNLVAYAAARGDRQAESVFWDLYCLTRNVRNAVEVGDLQWARQMMQDAHGRALLRSALG